MEYTTLGKTGLKVSVAGLGCGGFSGIGKGTGKSESESVAIVRQALDLGVNFIDTSAAYGTESIVGRAIKGYDRDAVVISTKARVGKVDDLRSPREVVESLEQSLRNLGVDCIDVFHLHGVPPKGYDYAFESLVPALLRHQESGKFKFLGISEIPPDDAEHETLVRAVQAECFSVVMVAYHMLHQSARSSVFPVTLEKGIGVLGMFAVRLLFSEQGRLKRVVDALVDEGRLPDEAGGDGGGPLEFLIHEAGARSVIDAAYRYCRHSDGLDVVLFGTGNPDHLTANIESILSPPLLWTDVDKLETLFGSLIDVGLDAPGRVKG